MRIGRPSRTRNDAQQSRKSIVFIPFVYFIMVTVDNFFDNFVVFFFFFVPETTYGLYSGGSWSIAPLLKIKRNCIFKCTNNLIVY